MSIAGKFTLCSWFGKSSVTAARYSTEYCFSILFFWDIICSIPILFVVKTENWFTFFSCHTRQMQCACCESPSWCSILTIHSILVGLPHTATDIPRGAVTSNTAGKLLLLPFYFCHFNNGKRGTHHWMIVLYDSVSAFL